MNTARAISMLMMVSLSGCAYPVYKQLKPEALVTVRDEQGQPLPNAEVFLRTTTYPYGRPKPNVVRKTDANGVARFDRESEWRVEALALHGAEVFSWSWCVAKSGYQTRRIDYDRRTPYRNTIVLEKGVSEPCQIRGDYHMDDPVGSWYHNRKWVKNTAG